MGVGNTSAMESGFDDRPGPSGAASAVGFRPRRLRVARRWLLVGLLSLPLLLAAGCGPTPPPQAAPDRPRQLTVWTLDLAPRFAPYMGRDSVEPFLVHPGKWAIVLALTSNAGAFDFETLTAEGKPLYSHVLEKCSTWGTPENTMYVVGATRAEMLAEVRGLVPDHFLLVPGVGAQGGSLEEVMRHGMNEEVGLLINTSRSILYASSGVDFASAAAAEAKSMQQQMSAFIS